MVSLTIWLLLAQIIAKQLFPRLMMSIKSYSFHCASLKGMIPLIDAFGFVIRQSSYYRQAAEILGLIMSEDNYRYKLTPKGEQFLRLPAEKCAGFICKLLLEFPVMNSIFIDISAD
jgi:hypothetical protein